MWKCRVGLQVHPLPDSNPVFQGVNIPSLSPDLKWGWAASWTEGTSWQSAKSSSAAAATCTHYFRTPAWEGRPPGEALEKGQLGPHPSSRAGRGRGMSWSASMVSCRAYEDAAPFCSHFSWCSGHTVFQNTLFLRVSPEKLIFSRCSTRGCFSYTYLHMLKHATYVVCVGSTHACLTSAFSLATYDMGVWLDF